MVKAGLVAEIIVKAGVVVEVGLLAGGIVEAGLEAGVVILEAISVFSRRTPGECPYRR